MKTSHGYLFTGITTFAIAIANAAIHPTLRNQRLAIVGVVIAGLLIVIAVSLSKRKL